MRPPRLAAAYGFGAARLPVSVPPHRPMPHGAGLRVAAAELASARGLAALLRTGALAAAVAALTLAIAPRHREAAEIVWLAEPERVLPAELAPPPAPPEPLPAPAEATLAEAPPAPPQPVIAEVPPPAPPVQRPATPPPRAPEPAPAPEPPRAVAVRPAIAPPAPPRALPSLEPSAPVRRATPIDVARVPAPPRPRIDALAAPEAEAAPPRPSRAARSAPEAPRGAARIALALPAAPAPDLGPSDAPAAAPVLARAARSPAAPVARPAAVRPPPLALPGLAAAARAPAPAPSAPSRTAPAEPQHGGSPRDPEGAARLRGVSLAALAACVSDREEDALRQRIVAAVSRPEECTSPSGRYRFIETKNVNAFLLWIERSPSRRAGDRCEELALALDCLARGSRRELHEG